MWGSFCPRLRNCARRLCWGLYSLCLGTSTGGRTGKGEREKSHSVGDSVLKVYRGKHTIFFLPAGISASASKTRQSNLGAQVQARTLSLTSGYCTAPTHSSLVCQMGACFHRGPVKKSQEQTTVLCFSLTRMKRCWEEPDNADMQFLLLLLPSNSPQSLGDYPMGWNPNLCS